MKTEPFDLPQTVIKEGKIVYHTLKEKNKDEGWLVHTLNQTYQTEVQNVLLATIDGKTNLSVFFYK